MQQAIYLDYAATTPVDPQVAKVMMMFLGTGGTFGNPASRTHRFGWEAEKAVEHARQELAGLINAEPDEIIWTSGATESDNLAIKGVVSAYADHGRHIVTSAIEHRAVLDSCRYLESQGYDVTYMKPSIDGVISPDQVSAALRSDTILVSLMHVNNELGTVTDIQAIAEITRERKIPFHVDAAQSAARLTLDMQSTQADLLSLSGHKMYGPKGIGALYVRRNPRTRLEAQMHGGGHERGMRSGTLPTHQIVGMGEAACLVKEQFESDVSRIEFLSKRLLGRLGEIEQLSVNGKRRHCVPGIMNVTIASVESESLIMMLKGNIAISTGSACTSASVEPSHVLMALGVDEEAAHSSLRLSLGRFTTAEEIDYAVEQIIGAVNELRSISPTWIEPHNRIEA